MTLPGIITMALSVGTVWILFFLCCRHIIKNTQDKD